ncbi:unnamed protein product [Darwinula stevensoni]|uniref:Uncharacterized protein n=1 Tax=Darwinula stevensoni TaxID=69355 RepID=A0A7R8XBD6_9CRUS|nr:unnamed protein product [Darwinula stevensoni]CAG0886372.1 unnamed protein product [Darwinula stevensoni]
MVMAEDKRTRYVPTDITIQIMPSDEKMYAKRSQAYLDMENYSEAENNACCAYKLKIDFPKAYHLAAQAAVKMCEYKKCFLQYPRKLADDVKKESGVNQDPTPVCYWMAACAALTSNNQKNQAFAFLQEGLEHCPDSVLLKSLKSELESKEERPVDQSQGGQKAIEESKKSVSSSFNDLLFQGATHSYTTRRLVASVLEFDDVIGCNDANLALSFVTNAKRVSEIKEPKNIIKINEQINDLPELVSSGSDEESGTEVEGAQAPVKRLTSWDNLNQVRGAAAPAPSSTKAHGKRSNSAHSGETKSKGSSKRMPSHSDAGASGEGHLPQHLNATKVKEKKFRHLTELYQVVPTPVDEAKVKAKEFQELCVEGTDALLEEMALLAMEKFKQALELVEPEPHPASLEMAEEDVVVLKYAYAISSIQSGVHDYIRKALAVLEDIKASHANIRFPLVYHGLARAHMRLNK